MLATLADVRLVLNRRGFDRQTLLGRSGDGLSQTYSVEGASKRRERGPFRDTFRNGQATTLPERSLAGVLRILFSSVTVAEPSQDHLLWNVVGDVTSDGRFWKPSQQRLSVKDASVKNEP